MKLPADVSSSSHEVVIWVWLQGWWVEAVAADSLALAVQQESLQLGPMEPRWSKKSYVAGSAQDCGNSNVLGIELPQSYKF